MNCPILPIQLTPLVLTRKPPTVHGVIDVGLDQLVCGLVQHQLVPAALINVVQVEGGEVCKLSVRFINRTK